MNFSFCCEPTAVDCWFKFGVTDDEKLFALARLKNVDDFGVEFNKDEDFSNGVGDPETVNVSDVSVSSNGAGGGCKPRISCYINHNKKNYKYQKILNKKTKTWRKIKL